MKTFTLDESGVFSVVGTEREAKDNFYEVARAPDGACIPNYGVLPIIRPRGVYIIFEHNAFKDEDYVGEVLAEIFSTDAVRGRIMCESTYYEFLNYVRQVLEYLAMEGRLFRDFGNKWVVRRVG